MDALLRAWWTRALRGDEAAAITAADALRLLGVQVIDAEEAPPELPAGEEPGDTWSNLDEPEAGGETPDQ